MIIDLLIQTNMIRENYNQQKIPLGMGIVIFLSTIVAAFFVLFTTQQPMFFFMFLFGTASVAFAGIIDDILGDHSVKGVRGHLSQLAGGVLTTGGLKAIVGGLVSLLLAFWISNTWMERMIHVLLLVISINMINLFDVRPGRADKVFLINMAILWVLISAPSRFISLLTVGAVLGICGGDLKGRFMMGDVGSNLLGFTLGFTLVTSNQMALKISFLILYGIIHIIAERVSLSKIIENHKWLKKLDTIGTMEKNPD